MVPSSEYADLVKQVEGMREAVEKIGATSSSAETAAAAEFLLEGLHLNKRLNKDKVGGKTQYRG